VELTDAEIIEKSLDDPNAFGMVFERYYDTIFRFVARRQGLEPAADLTADVFARAFSLRGRYDTTRESCRPWLYGIASNIIGDEIRRQRRSERRHLAMIGLQGESDDPYGRADDKLAAQQEASRLHGSLASLRSRDRNVLLLYSIEELSYQEIADALNIPVGTVRSRLSRARRKISELETQLEQTKLRDQRKKP